MTHQQTLHHIRTELHQRQVPAHRHLYQLMYLGYGRPNISAERACNAHHPSKKCTISHSHAYWVGLLTHFCDRKPLPQYIDVSHSAQLRDIEASFAACNDPSQFGLSTLRHPNKQGVTAVESFEIYPDADIWANAYDLFRFSERPGEKPIDVSRGCLFSTIMFLMLSIQVEDPRLDCAILRPMESDGDHFLAYHLTKDDESAIEFKERRRHGAPTTLEEEPKVCIISSSTQNY